MVRVLFVLESNLVIILDNLFLNGHLDRESNGTNGGSVKGNFVPEHDGRGQLHPEEASVHGVANIIVGAGGDDLGPFADADSSPLGAEVIGCGCNQFGEADKGYGGDGAGIRLVPNGEVVVWEGKLDEPIGLFEVVESGRNDVSDEGCQKGGGVDHGRECGKGPNAFAL